MKTVGRFSAVAFLIVNFPLLCNAQTGGLPGGAFSEAVAPSGNGLFVVGASGASSTSAQAVLWNIPNAEAIQTIGVLTGGSSSTAFGVNYGSGAVGGLVVVGTSTATNFNSGEAFIWSAATGMQALGTLPGGQLSAAYGVNANSTTVNDATIVGQSGSTAHPLGEGFIWPPAGPMKPLGVLPGHASSTAFGVTPDGQLVVGYSRTSDGSAAQAVYWPAGATTPVPLTALAQATQSLAQAVNLDGSVIVGASNSPAFPNGVAVRWVNAAIQPLGTVQGDNASAAIAVSANGSLIVGQSGAGQGLQAFLWKPSVGMRPLQQVLNNPNFAGWTLTAALGISACNEVITGYGTNPQGHTQAWLAHLGVVDDTHDFNCDGKSDILWRSTNGSVALWLMNGNQVLPPGGFGNVPSNWSIIGQRDFDGDGKVDVLWRDNTGTLAMWFMNGLSAPLGVTLGNVPTNWVVYGTGDLNGDGRGDLLWQDPQSGTVVAWFMYGGQVITTANFGAVPGWTIVGNDNKGVIYWRNAAGNVALWKLAGNQITGTASLGNVPVSWTIAGLGDFNGDGVTDILWRNSQNGAVAIWFLNSALAVQSPPASLGVVGGTWQIAQTGDYNGDGTSDILWIDGAGNLAAWFMNGGQIATTAIYGQVGAGWSVQATNAE